MNRFKTSKFKNTTPKIAKKDVSSSRVQFSALSLALLVSCSAEVVFWGNACLQRDVQLPAFERLHSIERTTRKCAVPHKEP